MVRLIAPNGAHVDVAAEKVTRLIEQGFTAPVVEEPKAEPVARPRGKRNTKAARAAADD